MQITTKAHAIIVFIVALFISGCGAAGVSTSTTNEKTIKSTTSNGLTITLSSRTGEVTSGENTLILTFADSSGKHVDAGAVSLKLRMPAMGTMAEMIDTGTLTTTEIAGQYNVRLNVEQAG
ncbi:MAG TPA: FixH family protein, partial [Blastocatellia bacterium]|nr:FixH family protein [Blastocatellia bacterium]